MIRDDPKRSREIDNQSDAASLAATDGSESGDSDETEEPDSPRPSAKHNIEGSGPFTFYIWEAGICWILEGMGDEYPYFTLKSAALENFAPVAHLPKDERYEALCDIIDLEVWHVDEEDDDAKETPEAKLLLEKWNTRMRVGEEKVASDENDGWWYEVTLQREKPEPNVPTIEVSLERTGTWWMTDFCVADQAGNCAMSSIVDFTANSDL